MKNDVWAKWRKNGVTLSADHKSTHGKDNISIKRADLLRAFKDAEAMRDLGIVTFGYYQKRDLYGILPLDKLLTLIEQASKETIREIK